MSQEEQIERVDAHLEEKGYGKEMSIEDIAKETKSTYSTIKIMKSYGKLRSCQRIDVARMIVEWY